MTVPLRERDVLGSLVVLLASPRSISAFATNQFAIFTKESLPQAPTKETGQ
jgi:hypothetical protein